MPPVPLVEALGLPGLVDVHTHFLPPRVRAKVLAQFDRVGTLIGRPWPVRYRDDDATLVATLRGLDVRDPLLDGAWGCSPRPPPRPAWDAPGGRRTLTRSAYVSW